MFKTVRLGYHECMAMKKYLTLIITIIIVGVAVFVFGDKTHAPAGPIANDGASGDTTIGKEDHSIYDNSMHLAQPVARATVTSPLIVRGEARGTWFFEATFPLMLVVEDGTVLAQGFATAQDEWMTENFVPFEGTLTFTQQAQEQQATLVLMKDNPSGLPEGQDERTVSLYISEDQQL